MTMRRKRSRQQHTLLNSDELAELVCGPEYAMVRRDEFYRGFRGDRNAMREAWQRHRDALLAWWQTGEYSTTAACADFCDRVFPWVFFAGSPETRPWASEEFDA